MPELSLTHIRSLETLHSLFFTARTRKRKSLNIHPDEFQRFENALKAVLPPFDFQAHGFQTYPSNKENPNGPTT